MTVFFGCDQAYPLQQQHLFFLWTHACTSVSSVLRPRNPELRLLLPRAVPAQGRSGRCQTARERGPWLWGSRPWAFACCARHCALDRRGECSPPMPRPASGRGSHGRGRTESTKAHQVADQEHSPRLPTPKPQTNTKAHLARARGKPRVCRRPRLRRPCAAGSVSGDTRVAAQHDGGGTVNHEIKAPVVAG